MLLQIKTIVLFHYKESILKWVYYCWAFELKLERYLWINTIQIFTLVSESHNWNGLKMKMFFYIRMTYDTTKYHLLTRIVFCVLLSLNNFHIITKQLHYFCNQLSTQIIALFYLTNSFVIFLNPASIVYFLPSF